jgi:hypothetical protein
MGIEWNQGSNPQAVGTVRGHVASRETTTVFQTDRWDSEIWIELNAINIMSQFVMEVSRDKITGQTYHQPKVGRMGVRNKRKATPVNLQAYKEDEFNMTFKRYNESSFAIEDIASVFLDYELRAEWTREVALAVSRDIDHWILGYRVVLEKLGNSVTAKDSGNNNSPLNRAAILAAKLVMDLALVDQSERAWLFTPSQLISLLTIPEFISGDYVQGMPTMTGQIGTLYGSPVIINNNINKNSVNGLELITGVDVDGTRIKTNVPTPGFSNGSTSVSPYFPSPLLNGDAWGAGNHPEILVADTLPNNAYTGMLVRKGWLKHGWFLQPKTETDREITLTADLVVTTYGHDAKIYRPENAVLIHSYETI